MMRNWIVEETLTDGAVSTILGLTEDEATELIRADGQRYTACTEDEFGADGEGKR